MAGIIDKQRLMSDDPGESPDTDQSMEGQEPDQGGSANLDDPAYKKAIALTREILYRQGAAKKVAQALKMNGDPLNALADTAYQMVMTVDDRTGGSVPDELIVALAAEILGEVADIAEAAGIKITDQMVAQAMRIMLLRYLSENGVDTRQLEQAMNGIDLSKISDVLGQQQESEA